MRYFGQWAKYFAVIAPLTAICLIGGEAAQAQSTVSVDGAWCLTSQYNQHMAFVYMTLTLEDETADALVGAVSPVADEVQILAPDPDGGRKKLAQVPVVPLDPHAPTVFQPTETHLLLKGLNRKLMPGDEFAVTLNFQRSGSQDAQVKVLKYPPSAGMPDIPKDVKME